jgi:hypothetical protein
MTLQRLRIGAAGRIGLQQMVIDPDRVQPALLRALRNLHLSDQNRASGMSGGRITVYDLASSKNLLGESINATRCFANVVQKLTSPAVSSWRWRCGDG